jgi:beta-lactamase regulating signal transducer with metallopeptidase domain
MINLAQTMIESGWMKALGWTFVHSIWQIALIGLLLFIVLRMVPGRSAHVRYTISSLALWLIVVASLSTFIIMLPEDHAITTMPGAMYFMTVNESQSTLQQLSQWLELRMPMMLTIWLGGVSLLMLRLVLSLGFVHHMRYESFPEEDLQQTLNTIIARIRLKIKATVSESYLIKSPVTIGHIKPLILFPVGIINQLNPKEVEAILTHELAHIVRRDYLSNLIQSFIETLFYYHPVTWWISRMVRTERENRADDLAVSWCGDHLGYAKALMAVQELQVHAKPALTIGFSSRKGAMLARISRILNLPYKNHNQMEKTVLLSLCSLCFLAFTLTSHTNIIRKEKETADKITYITPMAEAAVVIDSIPTKGSYLIHKKTDDQDISIQVEDGDIKELKVDGKAIAPSAYSEYDDVISELFGAMEAPMPVEGYRYAMPAMPDMPSMPAMPGMPAMPNISLMPFDVEGFSFPQGAEFEMYADHIEFDHGGNFYRLPNGGHMEIFGAHGLEPIQMRELKGYNFFHSDTTAPGLSRIIIIEGKDTVFINSPQGDFNYDFKFGPGPGHPLIIDGQNFNTEEWQKIAEQLQQNTDGYRQQWKASEKDWKAQEEQWREMSKDWEKQWKEEWKANEGQWKAQMEEWKAHEGEWRANQDQYKHELRLYELNQGQLNELKNMEELKLDLNMDGLKLDREHLESLGHLRTHNRLSMSDQMVADGLIRPGEDAEVQLTPDKLKINGKKMDSEMHQKYLRMYERQQGVELSGNSRVEFTTKSKQRM